MADRYRYISGDSHLEVNSNRWVHRVAEKYRTVAPKVVTMPDGGDGWTVVQLLIDGQRLLPLRARLRPPAQAA